MIFGGKMRIIMIEEYKEIKRKYSKESGDWIVSNIFFFCKSILRDL